MIEIEVDNLAVDVDKSDYETDPASVEKAVRDARETMRVPEDRPEAPDYDEVFG